MSKLSVDQKNIFDLLKDKKADFLIPDYQRPYAWQEKECQKLWDDIFEFAIPENDATRFDTNDEQFYYISNIVHQIYNIDANRLHWIQKNFYEDARFFWR